jgi:acetolactate synthase-1/2/3 large subunit
MISVADYIIKFLVNKGIDHTFVLPGGAAMFLNDAVANNKDMKYTAVHHEQTTTIAAECYGRYRNKMAVAMVTAGPGSTNAITGVAGAFIDSAPMLVLSGQSKRVQTVQNSGLSNFRQMGAQEVDIIPVVKSITKFSTMVNDPQKIRYYLEKAIYFAKEGRKGPVWLDIPIDVQSSLIDENILSGFDLEEVEEQEYDNILVKAELFIELVKSAKRPVVIAGNGVRSSNSEGLLYEVIINKLDIPVVTTRLGCDVIEYDNKNYVGRVGIRGDRAGNFAMQNADLVISLGSRLCVPVTGYDYDLFAREAKVVMVDIDDAELNKNTVTIHYPMKCELNLLLTKINELLGESKVPHNEWIEKCNHWKNKFITTVDEYFKQKEFVNTYCLVDSISKLCNEEDVILSDAGSAVDVVYHAFNITKKQRVLLSGGLASMGHSLPGSIGAAVASNKNVICITGDGSVHMNIQELSTIAFNNLPVKIFMLNNNGYLTIRGAQYTHFNGRLIAEGPNSGLGFPNFEVLANAYNLPYVKIENNEQLKAGIDRVLELEGPVFCEVMVAERQLIAPKQSSMAMPDGRMVSRPLEDMFPFLSREEFEKEMVIKTI